MAERNLPSALKTSLLANDEYVYAHLVKFEKPRQSSEVGKTAQKASDYAYITDGSANIKWDDGTVDSRGNLNGEQTYVANKLLSVGTVQETTEARASNLSLVLSGTALGTVISANVSFTSGTLTANTDLFTNGFQEGDKVFLESNTGLNNGKYVTITGFSNSNQTISFTSEQTINSESATAYTLSLASEELTALIRNKNTSSGLAYSSYMNREVFVYRAHINPETGQLIGTPFQIFRGIISKGSIDENPEKDTRITWSLTSHWGDFVRLQGRITSDPYHRALTTAGTSDLGAVLRPEYANDYGFMHAESAVNVTGIYQTMETRYKMKKRGGIAGLLGGKKLVEYEVEVDREVDLQFNLSAKYLPVVYGVQKVDSIPVFADTLAEDASTLYIAYAITEGEIGGIYDIHIDDSSTVCIDQNDYDVRSSGDSDVLCNGRADRGDVLAASSSFVSGSFTTVNIPGAGPVQIPNFNLEELGIYGVDLGIATNAPGGQGLTHETSFTFTTPIDASFMVHTGKSDQLANQELVKLGVEQKFKIQNDYFISSGDARPYWSSSHKLLDTAYAVGKFTLSEGEATIPKYEFVVRGKVVDCYNYDGSYAGTGNPSAFSLGDTVSIRKTDGTLIAADVRIIDKWSFYTPEGTLEYRFRFDTELPLVDTTAFYMTDGKSAYNFFTWDHVESDTTLNLEGGFPYTFISGISIDNSSYKAEITLFNPSSLVESALTELTSFIKFNLRTTINGVETNFGTFSVESYNPTTNVVTTTASFNSIQKLEQVRTSGTGRYFVFTNALRLDSADPNTTDNAYAGRNITLTRYDDVTDIPYSRTFKVSAYDGGTKIATTTTNYEEGEYVVSSLSEYEIEGRPDRRVSINPAIQLLDYLTSSRYGKGLDISKDIDLESFKEAARLCDTQSDVTIISTSSASIGDVYQYTASGRLIFEGTVKSSTLRTVGGTNYYEIVFTNVIGKLGYKWNNWRTYTAGDLYWHSGNAYIAASTSTITTAPTSGALTSLSLSRVGGGTLSVSITDGYTASGNPIVKSFTNTTEGFNSPGYSLYDADDVKYWKYVGWDEPEQRYVTRHQMNQVINTSTPIFDNINSMLQQFNGILRYSAGKYSLDIETAAPDAFSNFQRITEDDIIGNIKIDDKGQKDSFNSMSANIVDPANKYAARSISFFNSEYLKEDKGIRRQGNFAMPGISNYYNARINIKQYLDESRYGITISFTIDSKGYLLLAGTIITLTHSKFDWVEKQFRISSLNFQENGLVDIVAEEHNDEAYLVENIRTSLVTGTGDSGGSTSVRPTVIGGPDLLIATTTGYNAIDLIWTNASAYNSAYTTTLIYYSEVNDISEALPLAEVIGNNYTHVLLEGAGTSYYYWVQHVLTKSNGAKVYSEFNDSEGTLGTALGVFGAFSVKLTSSDYSIRYDSSGLNPVYTNDLGEEATGEGNLLLTATTIGFANPLYRFTVDGVEGEWTETNTSLFAVPTEDFSPSKFAKVDVAFKPEGWIAGADPEAPEYVADPGVDDIISSDEIVIFAVKSGSGAITVIMSNEGHTAASEPSGDNPILTGSGTTIEVFEGGILLNAVATEAVLEPGQYKISSTTVSPENSITVGTIDISNSEILVVGDHSNMTEDQVVIEYTIEVLRSDGVTGLTFTKKQSISKAKAGVSGSSVSIFDIYQLTNSATAPTNPSGTYKYNFETAELLDSNDVVVTSVGDWDLSASSVTSTNKYLWRISEGVSAASGATVDTSVTFTASPVLVSVYGESEPTINRHLITIYNLTNSATAPALPTQDITYDFTSGSFTAGSLDGGWNLSASSVTDSNRYLWQTNVVVSSTSDTIIIDGSDGGVSDWDTPVIVAYKGPDGSDGLNNAEAYLYRRTATATAPDSPTSGNAAFTFGVGITSEDVNNFWQVFPANGILATSGRYLWRISATASSSESSITVPYTSFGAPELIAVDGEGFIGESAVQVSASNLNHTFIANTSGIVTNNNFSCSFVVSKEGTAYSYASTGTAENTYGITLSNAANCTPTNTSGQLTISATSDILDTASVVFGSFEVTIFDRGNANNIVAEYKVTLTKIAQAFRDGGIFTFTGYNGTYAAAWAGSLTLAAAQAVAASVINSSSDGYISPNDRITVTDGTNAATRIYTGPRTNVSSTVSAANFSSTVVEIFNGSVIVDGTLSADKLTANATFTNNLNVSSRMTLGNIGGTGIINSPTKTSYSDSDAGIYMDTNSNFNIGDANTYLKFDTTNGLQVKGSFTISSGDITSGLGYTPYDSANPSGFVNAVGAAAAAPIQSISGTGFTTVGGSVTFNENLLSFSSQSIIDWLQYTPYDSTNPSGFVNAAAAAAAAPIQSITGNGFSVVNKQATFDSSALVFTTTQVDGFDSAAAAAAPVQSVAGLTGSISVAALGSAGLFLSSAAGPLATVQSIAADSQYITGLLNSAYNSTSFNSSAAAAAPVQSVAGETGAITVANLGSAGLFLASSAGPLATLGATTSTSSFTAGKIVLSSGSLDFTTGATTANNTIVMDTTLDDNSIKIYDGTTLRVKIGKL